MHFLSGVFYFILKQFMFFFGGYFFESSNIELLNFLEISNKELSYVNVVIIFFFFEGVVQGFKKRSTLYSERNRVLTCTYGECVCGSIAVRLWDKRILSLESERSSGE